MSTSERLNGACQHGNIFDLATLPGLTHFEAGLCGVLRQFEDALPGSNKVGVFIRISSLHVTRSLYYLPTGRAKSLATLCRKADGGKSRKYSMGGWLLMSPAVSMQRYCSVLSCPLHGDVVPE